MIGISKLYCGTVEPSDALRYGRKSSSLPSHLLQFSIDKRPVVVWNVTRRCNLKCVHCYAHAKDRSFDDELTTQEGKSLIDDLITPLINRNGIVLECHIQISREFVVDLRPVRISF